MRFFLRSPQFRKTAIIVAIILVLTISASVIGGFMAPQAGLFGAIAAPFQKLGASISDALNENAANYESAAKLNAEKEALEKEVNELREQLVDYQQAMNQNKFYEDYLGIKEVNPDFKFCSGMIISSDPDDIFGGFTVDAGSLNGISLYDPVVTDAGLVGYVTQVGPSTSKITTILSPALTCGAFDSRTGDAGALSGTSEFATSGNTRFYNLPRTCSVAVGDIIVTSGNGIFPENLIIGTVTNIGNDSLSSSLYATIEPVVDLKEITQVMIITSFAGQGNPLIDKE